MNQRIKFFLASLAVLLIGASCQRQDQPVGANDPGKVVIKLSLPEDMQALRASANSTSAKGVLLT